MAVGAAAFYGLALLRVQKCLLCQVLLRGTNAFPFDFRGIGVLKPSCKCVLLSLTLFNAFHFLLDNLISLVYWGEMRRYFFSVHPFSSFLPSRVSPTTHSSEEAGPLAVAPVL